MSEPARNRYATPRAIVLDLAARFAGGLFHLDAAAEPWSAKAPWFFTREHDALSRPWGPFSALKHAARSWRARRWYSFPRPSPEQPTHVFCNPPYDAIGGWIDHALEARDAGVIRVAVFVVPPGLGTRWWRRAATHADLHSYDGRIPFEPPPGLRASGANRQGSAVIVISQPMDVRRILAPRREMTA